MSRSIAVIARLTPRPEARTVLRGLLDGMIHQSRLEDGCRSYDLYESADGGELVLFERYRSRNALDEHRRSAHYLRYRAQVAELLTQPVAVTELAPLDEASA
ncbi:putative quinol monooxygenase [Mycobacterium decipiens]|uniref:Antibiotic biosynthesis monooxygenase n=1 Tax=Mycobacterium decipiens TaxID=1430326 RepID=A0A1X2LR22_9MYCO|nr:putative quinol monooxygenase [Mycobacterium decipiens]OSC38983.1 antibiotic biosynthesis monooxygenase [Mycobacterium decipiens]